MNESIFKELTTKLYAGSLTHCQRKKLFIMAKCLLLGSDNLRATDHEVIQQFKTWSNMDRKKNGGK